VYRQARHLLLSPVALEGILAYAPIMQGVFEATILLPPVAENRKKPYADSLERFMYHFKHVQHLHLRTDNPEYAAPVFKAIKEKIPEQLVLLDVGQLAHEFAKIYFRFDLPVVFRDISIVMLEKEPKPVDVGKVLEYYQRLADEREYECMDCPNRIALETRNHFLTQEIEKLKAQHAADVQHYRSLLTRYLSK
jgi:hypothetical protein